jgi:small subunit ribosomal protein S9
LRSVGWTCRACKARSRSGLTRKSISTTIRRQQTSTDDISDSEPISAAPEIDLDGEDSKSDTSLSQKPARVVPASPSYFTTTPGYYDQLLMLQQFSRDYAGLPTVLPEQAPQMSWMGLMQYRSSVGENVGAAKFSQLLQILKRLNRIHPQLRTERLRTAMDSFRRPGAVDTVAPTPRSIDEYGRSDGVGKRKSSSARVTIVEGSGEVIINGRPLVQAFPRLHDRESAVWPLKVTNRLDKYNVFVVAHGGGLTGQAESITLGLSKALLVQEPALKPVLRKGMFCPLLIEKCFVAHTLTAGCITRIMKRVERKKAGRVKARKKPAWNRR